MVSSITPKVKRGSVQEVSIHFLRTQTLLFQLRIIAEDDTSMERIVSIAARYERWGSRKVHSQIQEIWGGSWSHTDDLRIKILLGNTKLKLCIFRICDGVFRVTVQRSVQCVYIEEARFNFVNTHSCAYVCIYDSNKHVTIISITFLFLYNGSRLPRPLVFIAIRYLQKFLLRFLMLLRPTSLISFCCISI